MAKVIIIGSGPAGVSAALYTARAGIDTTIISLGIGNLDKAHLIENYYGFSEPVSGRDLAMAGIEGAKKVGVKFVEEEAVGISFQDSLVVDTNAGSYPADYIVIATGASRKSPVIKNLKELEGRGVSYCAVCDAFFYRNKSVAVLGNGEYALHEIETLQNVVKSVTLLTNGGELKTEVPEGVSVITSPILELTGDELLREVVFKDGSSIETAGLFVAYGTAGSSDFARKIGAEIKDNHIVVDENMQTTIPGLYAAGDCTGGMLQVAKAVYEGAVAGTHISRQIKKND